ncbi:hypothetical protein ACHAWF_000427, partial [Thalassiosira exigua]
MKAAAHVTDEIIGTAVQVFLDHMFEVNGAPYESDFQLVYWDAKEVLGRVMEGSEGWKTKDLISYSALSGCEFIPRLYRLKTDDIEAFMNEYKKNERPLDGLLRDLSHQQHWPAGGNKKGAPATDFVKRVKICTGLMAHAP